MLKCIQSNMHITLQHSPLYLFVVLLLLCFIFLLLNLLFMHYNYIRYIVIEILIWFKNFPFRSHISTETHVVVVVLFSRYFALCFDCLFCIPFVVCMWSCDNSSECRMCCCHRKVNWKEQRGKGGWPKSSINSMAPPLNWISSH